MPKLFTDPEAVAEDIIRDVGTNLVVGLPLGLGKANHIINALYARAAADRAIKLTIFSALTLEKPRPKNLLEQRFIAPVIERLFGGYPDLAYAEALHANALPPNVQVIEFFFLAGKWLHVPFAQPPEPISDTKYAIGLHAAGLVRDGGTLQIGIGQVGDALAQGLIVRHRDNAQFHGIMKRLGNRTESLPALETGSFEQGLYGVSEMLFEAFLGLIDAGILKREVDGVLLHGAFFLGPKSFYRTLREMTPGQIARIQMMPVSFTNEIYGDEAAKRRARVNARFVNNAMMATLMGAVISDGLENGQVVSGVGGQYNFVAQAFALQGARSILTVEATWQAGARTQSNIRWSYGHETIPRHLRDVIVTEYGVADIRGKSDADVIATMLQIADSRFQGELARQAKDAGKLPKNFEIPAPYRENFPERITRALKPAREAGMLPSFPFGSDFYQ